MVGMYYVSEEPAACIFRLQKLKGGGICMKVGVPYFLSNPWNLSSF
jgi:hypothetical protein